MTDTFEKIIARAHEIAAERFRRMVFDTNMRPEAADLVRDEVVDSIAERIVSRWMKQSKENTP